MPEQPQRPAPPNQFFDAGNMAVLERDLRAQNPFVYEENEIKLPAVHFTSNQPPMKKVKTRSSPGARTRISALGYPHPISEKWKEYPDGLWVHHSEEEIFHDHWDKDYFSKEYHRITEMRRIMLLSDPIDAAPDDLKNYVHPSSADKCVFEEMSELYYEPGVLKEISIYRGKFLVTPWILGVHFVHDYIALEPTPRHNAIQVVCDDDVKFADTRHLGERVLRCPSCRNAFDAMSELFSREKGKCHSCDIEFEGARIIRRHDAILEFSHFKSSNKRIRKGRYGEFRRIEVPEIRLFGIELEVEVDYDRLRVPMAKVCFEGLGKEFVAIKHDGSLTGNRPDGTGGSRGFEIVSAPADLGIHRSKWGVFDKIAGYNKLRSWDRDRCGMHIHVSREALGYLQIGRIISFVNHPDNADFIRRVAGRGLGKYCASYPSIISDGTMMPEKSDDNRRVAINLCNKHTVEFRIFRGTINPQHIIRNLEFVDALCSYCGPAERSLVTMFAWEEFVDYVVNTKSWPHDPWPIFSTWVEQTLIKKPLRKRSSSLIVNEGIGPGIPDTTPAKSARVFVPFRLSAGGRVVLRKSSITK